MSRPTPVARKLLLRPGLLLALAGAAWTAPGVADEVVLKNGSRIIGTITGARDGEVTVETDFAGTLTIALDVVESMHSSAPLDLLLADDSVVRDQPLQVDGGQLVTAGAAARPLDELRVVNPEPWELGQGYRAQGRLSFAAVLERGNTDTDELDYALETSWRSVRDRFRLKGDGERDEANGEMSADNWEVAGKYDYFLEGPNYTGIFALAEHDEFADLDLRWLVGPYIGRQFYEEPVFTLSAEVGASYVTEEFDMADDQHYPAGNWAVDLQSNYLGGESRLYLNQFGLWNLEDTSDAVINTTLGLAFPLLWNFETAAEILWEYDSGAVDGVDEMDQTYSVRVGYSW